LTKISRFDMMEVQVFASSRKLCKIVQGKMARRYFRKNPKRVRLLVFMDRQFTLRTSEGKLLSNPINKNHLMR